MPAEVGAAMKLFSERSAANAHKAHEGNMAAMAAVRVA